MFELMVVIFVLGYAAIALEHPLRVDKSASALLTGVLTWAVFALFPRDILSVGASPTWEGLKTFSNEVVNGILPLLRGEGKELPERISETLEIASSPLHFVKHELAHHLVEIAEILFFLLGAMTIVETVDHYKGFKLLTDKIKTTNKVKLLWILSLLTFFMSAALDNLTTTIVLVALLRKLIADKETRWFFASIVVLAANAGGAWSPIGDVTTIMLWVKGNVTTGPIIRDVLLPSFICLIVPLTVASFMVKGSVERPEFDDSDESDTPQTTKITMLILGISCLLFVPVFKTVTHLPPYMGMLLGLGVVWLTTEFILIKRSDELDKHHYSVIGVLKKIDVPTIFFFLGILTAVAALQTAGHLALLAGWLDKVTAGNIYIINLAIGVLSSVVDNVPLVAGAMGMYNVAEIGAFAQDGAFWQFLAYCAGTGGSILIIGSAAGVAAMGMEKIDFIWYFKRISFLATIGYLAGAGVYVLVHSLMH